MTYKLCDSEYRFMAEKRLFDLEILRDALNDKIGFRKAVLVRLSSDTPGQLLRFSFGQATGAHQRGLVVFDESLCSVETFPAPVPKRHAQTALGKNLHKRRPHVPEAATGAARECSISPR